MREVSENYDVVVCGGGLAGLSAAVAAARQGAKTCLIQDRPVFGGNSSSEIRVTPHGTAQFHAYGRETGIISEILIEERFRNHQDVVSENGWMNSPYDMVLYDLAVTTPNLTFHLNTSILAVHLEGGTPGNSAEPSLQLGLVHRPSLHGNHPGRIKSITASIAAAETRLQITGRFFIDCTGDGVVADLAGCEWRMGSESREEFNEPHAPAKASRDTMGSSIQIRCRDMGRPCPFVAPSWAVKYEDAGFFYKSGRGLDNANGGFWWIEIGVPWDTIHDAETIRHELTRHTLGVWDFMKNRDEKWRGKIDNYALDFIGQVPGKRESRRIVGQYFMTEHDAQNCTVFPDEIAFGGWFIDLHTPGGLLAKTSEQSSSEGWNVHTEYAVKSYCGPYGVPLRALISKDVDNLLLAGRNISVTHAALGSVRVMGTTALMGQAAGTAAAVALRRGISVAEVPHKAIEEVKQTLLREGCFLPNSRNEDAAELARKATASASSEAKLIGVGPHSIGIYNGMGRWGYPEDVRLTRRLGQCIAVAARIEWLGVCLTNRSSTPQRVEVELYKVDHVWDYRVAPGEPLARTTFVVPPGVDHWLDWDVHIPNPFGSQSGFVRLDLLSNPEVSWPSPLALEPGCTAVQQISPKKMRCLRDGLSLNFRIEPPQPAYAAGNVLTGVTRPLASTNLWRSDAAQPLPQWIELAWPSAQSFKQIEITFPGHILREYHAYPAFYRDPQCARDYRLSIWTGAAWQDVVEVRDNYHRHRRHTLSENVRTDKLRVTILSTNGDPSAGVYEIRCYA